MPPVRRLTAILAADVVGYSRLMGADEEGTHEWLKAHLRELIEIGEHRGRVVKNTGDGFLAEFASVVDAVRCAAEIQRAMADRNAETPEDKRITFRVGINLGDVIVEEHDIFGDGVNVAARLEALAEPGGICVSRVVRDRLDFTFEDCRRRAAWRGAGDEGQCQRAGSILAWPAISPPSSPTSAGVVQPHSLMLAAIAATWASVWVRAFLAYGISRSIAHRSTLSAGHGF
jgi:class 3 adenylate cyclase